ncbi:MAG TPA: GNVR domain-containing protein [Pirellulales bacterium]|jgi:uncharacterized protein involved in exopolysaccharide biosynthesis|nr:GNVR domain-containing protein [Pirellulales bacterium]
MTIMGLQRPSLDNATMTPTSEITLRDAYRTLFRHRRKMAAWFVFSVVAATLITFFGPQAFRSDSKLLVRLGRENVALDPTATLGESSTVEVPLSREDEINSEVVMLGSRVLLEKVVDLVGPEAILEEDDALSPEAGDDQPAESAAASLAFDWLDFLRTPLTARDRAIHKLQKMVEIEPVKKSNVIEVYCDTASAALSQKIISSLVDFYLDQHIRMNRTTGSREFFDEQLQRLRQDLVKSEEQLRDLKNETGISSPDDQRKIIVERIGRLEDQWLEAASEASASRAQVELLKKQFAEQEETQVTALTVGFANDAADGMQQQLYELQLKYHELLAKYTNEHPAVAQVREQLEKAQAVWAREERSRSQVTTGPNRAHEEMKLALLAQEPILASLEAKSKTLQGQLKQEQGELAELNANDVRLGRLLREVELKDEEYRKYAGHLEQATIDQELELQRISNVNVLQPATYQPKPVRPHKLLNLALGLLIGMFGSAALALAAEGLDHSLQSPEDIENKLELTTLASIPRLRPEHFIAHERN